MSPIFIAFSTRDKRRKNITAWQVFFFSLFFISQVTVVRAEPKEATLTLSIAIQRALAQNPSLRAFQFRDAALRGKNQTANLTPGYELEIETENFGGSGELSSFDAAELTVALSSVIEMGNKRAARVNVVSGGRFFLEAQKQVESLDLMGEVTRRYVDVLAAQEQVSLAAEALELAGNTLNIVKKRAKAGATPAAEVKRAQAELGQAELALLSERQRLEYLKIALAALWGETFPQFSKVKGKLLHFDDDIAFETLYAKVAANPAVQIFAAEERLKDAEVRLIKTESSANIQWSVGVRRSQESSDTALVAGFSMPIFSSKRNTGAVSTALAERNQIMAEKEVTLINLHTQLFHAFYNRKQAILVSKSLNDTIIPALQEALNETQLAYQRGRYSYLEYVSARQELLNARRMLIEAASSALSYGAEIEQLTAEPLSTSINNEKNEFLGSQQ